MIENLNNLVKQNADATIINNTAIPNERNEEAVQEASTAIEDSLKTSLSSGNVKEVANLFNGTGENVTTNPVTQQATGNFIDRLQSRFGVDVNQAANIANNLLKTAAGGGIAIGPILLGAAKPVHILTPSATVRRIVNMTALTVADANAPR